MAGVTLAATQFAMSEDRGANLDKAEAMVRRAAKAGADIVLLPELFETPYFCKDQLPEFFDWARPIEANPMLDRMAALRVELGVVLPFPFLTPLPHPHYNSLL